MSIKRIIENIKYLWRWHPEVAIRYWPIVQKIKSTTWQTQGKNRILEVGSGWLGIAPYLGTPIIGLDEDFGDKKFNLLNQVKGDILRMPFKSDSFDFIICVDMLEHLPSKERIKAVEEIFRVARKKVFLAVPCGEQSLKQDKQLDQKYKKIFKKSFSFLAEHLKYGIPGEEEMVQLIKVAARKYKKQIKIEVKGNENLTLRAILMKGWITDNFLVDIFFRKILLLFLPLFFILNKPPYYRRIFFVTIKV
jgi:predicted SAM-dependent methyltransferase